MTMFPIHINVVGGTDRLYFPASLDRNTNTNGYIHLPRNTEIGKTVIPLWLDTFASIIDEVGERTVLAANDVRTIYSNANDRFWSSLSEEHAVTLTRLISQAGLPEVPPENINHRSFGVMLTDNEAHMPGSGAITDMHAVRAGMIAKAQASLVRFSGWSPEPEAPYRSIHHAGRRVGAKWFQKFHAMWTERLSLVLALHEASEQSYRREIRADDVVDISNASTHNSNSGTRSNAADTFLTNRGRCSLDTVWPSTRALLADTLRHGDNIFIRNSGRMVVPASDSLHTREYTMPSAEVMAAMGIPSSLASLIPRTFSTQRGANRTMLDEFSRVSSGFVQRSSGRLIYVDRPYFGGRISFVLANMLDSYRLALLTGISINERVAGDDLAPMRKRLMSVGFSHENTQAVLTAFFGAIPSFNLSDNIRSIFGPIWECRSCAQYQFGSAPTEQAATAVAHAVRIGAFSGTYHPEGSGAPSGDDDSGLCGTCISQSPRRTDYRILVLLGNGNPSATAFHNENTARWNAQYRQYWDAHVSNVRLAEQHVPCLGIRNPGEWSVRNVRYAIINCTVNALMADLRTLLSADENTRMTQTQNADGSWAGVSITYDSPYPAETGDTCTASFIGNRLSDGTYRWAGIAEHNGQSLIVRRAQGDLVARDQSRTPAVYTDANGISWENIDASPDRPSIYLTSATESSRFLGRAIGIEFETGSGFTGGANQRNRAALFVTRMRERNAHTDPAPWAIKTDGSLSPDAVEIVSPPMCGHAIEVGVNAYFEVANSMGFATENFAAGGHIHVEANDIFALLRRISTDSSKFMNAAWLFGYMSTAAIKIAREFVSRRRRNYHYCCGGVSARRSDGVVNELVGCRSYQDGIDHCGAPLEGRSGLQIHYRETVQGGCSIGGASRSGVNYTMEFRVWPSTSRALRVLARAEYSQKVIEFIAGVLTRYVTRMDGGMANNSSFAMAKEEAKVLVDLVPRWPRTGGAEAIAAFHLKRTTLVNDIGTVLGLSPECIKTFTSIHRQFFGPTYAAVTAGTHAALTRADHAEDNAWSESCDTATSATNGSDANLSLSYQDEL